MSLFTSREKGLLKWASIIGALIFAIYSIVTLSFSSQDKRLVEVYQYLSYLFIFAMFSVESIYKKDWKGLAILILPILLFKLLFYKGTFDSSIEEIGRLHFIYSLIPYASLFLIIRNFYYRQKKHLFSVYVAGIVVDGLHNGLYSIIDGISRQFDLPEMILKLPMHILFTPFLIWLAIIGVDRLTADTKNKGWFNMEASLDSATYLKRVRLLNGAYLALVVSLLLVSYFLNDRFIGLTTAEKALMSITMGLLYLHALIFIQSAKRLIATDKNETFLYWFGLPLLNLLPAQWLAKAPDSNKHLKTIEEERKMILCRNCHNKTSDFRRGTLCKLTDAKPDFEGLCPDFNMKEKGHIPIPKLAPVPLYRGMLFFVALAVIWTLFGVYVLIVGSRGDGTTLTTGAISIIVQWTLIYFIYNQKKWAILVYLGLIFLNFSWLLSTVERWRDIFYYTQVPYLVLSVLLVVFAMPAWRYIGQKPKSLNDELMRLSEKANEPVGSLSPE